MIPNKGAMNESISTAEHGWMYPQSAFAKMQPAAAISNVPPLATPPPPFGNAFPSYQQLLYSTCLGVPDPYFLFYAQQHMRNLFPNQPYMTAPGSNVPLPNGAILSEPQEIQNQRKNIHTTKQETISSDDCDPGLKFLIAAAEGSCERSTVERSLSTDGKSSDSDPETSEEPFSYLKDAIIKHEKRTVRKSVNRPSPSSQDPHEPKRKVPKLAGSATPSSSSDSRACNESCDSGIYNRAQQNAASEWANYNWHVRSGSRPITTENIRRRYFACDFSGCKAVLHEDTPTSRGSEGSSKSGDESKSNLVKITVHGTHTHPAPSVLKPNPELVNRGTYLLKTMSPAEVREVLIVEAKNGIGIPTLESLIETQKRSLMK